MQVPQALVSGAVGGANIGQLNDRNANDIYNQSTNYGRFIAKVNFVVQQTKLKRIIWRQGEADASSLNSAQNYIAAFTSLRNNLRQDITELGKIYVAQNDIISIDYIGYAQYAGLLRDNQRKLGELFNDVEVFGTAGTPGYDGLHYNWNGHNAIASWLTTMISDDENIGLPNENLYSPNVQEVLFNQARDSIVIIFQPNQVISFQEQKVYNSHTRRLADYLLIDDARALITALTSDGNKLILSLNQPSVATKLTYLPTHLKDIYSNFYDGPVISNTNGNLAMTFQDYPITRWLSPLTNLKIGVDNNNVKLTWDNYTATNKNIRIEVQTENLPTFQLLGEIASSES
ncbi:MAG: sialate O-acetylesterase, partial [Spirosomaceae bacterium]|nr:sialate O-acetylesterase [Spirosomataceae bacterium]